MKAEAPSAKGRQAKKVGKSSRGDKSTVKTIDVSSIQEMFLAEQ